MGRVLLASRAQLAITQEVGKNTRLRLAFLPTFVLTSLAACFISERSTLVAGLFVNYRSKDNTQLSRARVRQLIRAAWLFGFLITLLPMFSYQGIRTDLNETHYTVTCARDSSHTPYVVMFQIFLIIVYIFPPIFLIVTSYRILQVLRTQAAYRLALPGNKVPEKVLKEKRKQNKATMARTLIILIVAFVAAYLLFVGYHTATTIL